MGNISKFFSQQPQNDSTPKIDCLICYRPCHQFKKLHQKTDGQSPHFACILSRNELIKYWNKPICPIRVNPIFTTSNCHYFHRDSCQEIKNLSTCHRYFIDLHPRKSICCQCMTSTTTKCPLCKQPKDSKNPR